MKSLCAVYFVTVAGLLPLSDAWATTAAPPARTLFPADANHVFGVRGADGQLELEYLLNGAWVSTQIQASVPLQTMAAADASHIFAVALSDQSLSACTNSSGGLWTCQKITASVPLVAVSAPDSSHVYGIRKDNGLPTTCYGGNASWQCYDLPAPVFNAISAVDALHLMGLDKSGYLENCTFGSTGAWTCGKIFKDPFNQTFSAFSAPDNTHVYALDASGNLFAGYLDTGAGIWKYYDTKSPPLSSVSAPDSIHVYGVLKGGTHAMSTSYYDGTSWHSGSLDALPLASVRAVDLAHVFEVRSDNGQIGNWQFGSNWIYSELPSGGKAALNLALGIPAATSGYDELLDFLVGDICVDANDLSTSGDPGGDPAQCPRHRNMRIGESPSYIVTDSNFLLPSVTYQALVTIPVLGADGNLKIMTVKSMRGGFDPTFQFNFNFLNNTYYADGYDLMGFINVDGQRYASLLRTYDGTCFDQLWTLDGNPSNRGGWIAFPFPGDRSTPNPLNLSAVFGLDSAWANVATADVFMPGFDVNLAAVPNKCAPSTGPQTAAGVTLWTKTNGVAFASDKVLEAIRSDRFYKADLSDNSNGLERYYFTKAYGFSRWEHWVPPLQCKINHGISVDNFDLTKDSKGNIVVTTVKDYICDPRQALADKAAFHPGYATNCRINFQDTNTATANLATWGGQDWVRDDCRDSTNYVPLNNTHQSVMKYPMGQMNGIVDLKY